MGGLGGWKDVESRRASFRRYYAGMRTRTLLKLGGQCVDCGNTDLRVLQIHHLLGGGRAHRQAVSNSRYYKDIQEHSEQFQVLCANCHCIHTYHSDETTSMKE